MEPPLCTAFYDANKKFISGSDYNRETKKLASAMQKKYTRNRLSEPSVKQFWSGSG